MDSVTSYTYFDLNANQICQVRRTHDKKITQWTIHDNEWVAKGLPADIPKPLYNVLDLLKKPDAPILLVEGEKTCEAAKILFPDMVAMTWLGGSGTAKKANLDLLENKTVYLWPDNDDAGRKAMGIIANRLLREGAAKVLMINFDADEFPKGWDLADNYSGLPAPYNKDYELCEFINNANEVMLVVENAKPKSALFFRLRRSEKNNPLNKSQNIKVILDHLNIQIRFNEMTNTNEYFCDKETKQKEIIGLIYDECVEHRVPIVNLHGHLDTIAKNSRFHPVRDWIDSKPWDGTPRFQDLAATITTDNPLWFVLLHKWMLGAVYSIYDSNFGGMPGVIVFQGEQGKGKGEWIKRLCPLDFTLTEFTLDASNKDHIEQATTRWITELSEVGGTYSRSEVNALKAFIIAPYDTYRKAYARNSEKIKRKSAFIATSNDRQFLKDRTGNRRWWVIKVDEINYKHKLDMQQIWAEIKNAMLEDIKVGSEIKGCYLSQEQTKILAETNKEFEIVDPMEEMILEYFEPPIDGYFFEELSSTRILHIVGVQNPTQGQKIMAGNFLCRNFEHREVHKIKLYKVKRIMNR